MSFTSEELLLEKHGTAIRRIAWEFRVPANEVVTRDDLFHHGVEGMLDAARRYDPGHGVQFWTFAYPRVRGAMVDAIRAWTPMPSRWYRQLGAAEEALRRTAPGTREQREATRRVAEASEAVGRLSTESLATVRGEGLGVHDREPCPEDDDGPSRVMRLDAPDAGEQLETAGCAHAIHAAMRALKIEERVILRGIFFEERGLRDIATELGISISWASRIHTRALGRLKHALEADWGYQPEPARQRVRAPSAVRDWIDVVLEGDTSCAFVAIEGDHAQDTEVANAA